MDFPLIRQTLTMSERLLASLYYTPASAAAYGGVDRLWAAARKQDPLISRSTVKDWLASQLTYTLHKYARRNYPRQRYLVSRIDEEWEADLVDLQKYSRQNDGYKYLLVLIDVFSKQAHVRPLKSKSEGSVADALENIFQKVTPEIFRSDSGAEFKNKNVAALLRKYNIKQLFALNPATKAAVCERLNKSLKERMFKHFTKTGSSRYIDILQEIVSGYNASTHSSIGMPPDDVTTENSPQVFRNLYGVSTKREYLFKMADAQKKIHHRVGDRVRLKYELKAMDKRYLPNWSDEVYTVSRVIRDANPILYKISYQDRELPRRYYADELQGIKGVLHRVEVIRRDLANKRARVRFLGEKTAVWIPDDELWKV